MKRWCLICICFLCAGVAPLAAEGSLGGASGSAIYSNLSFDFSNGTDSVLLVAFKEPFTTVTNLALGASALYGMYVFVLVSVARMFKTCSGEQIRTTLWGIAIMLTASGLARIMVECIDVAAKS